MQPGHMTSPHLHVPERHDAHAHAIQKQRARASLEAAERGTEVKALPAHSCSHSRLEVCRSLPTLRLVQKEAGSGGFQPQCMGRSPQSTSSQDTASMGNQTNV